MFPNNLYGAVADSCDCTFIQEHVIFLLRDTRDIADQCVSQNQTNQLQLTFMGQ
jgi:hypothetical protein